MIRASQKGKTKTVYKFIRVLIATSLVMGIVLLAQAQVAWANHTADQSLSAENHKMQSVVPAPGDDDCDKDKSKDKDKGKDKDKCKGTVKPPSRDLIIPVTGSYSVGGFCTLSVEFNDPEITLDASIEDPLPGELPDDVQKIRQGCILTYYRSNQRLNELPPDLGNTTICFAGIPSKQMLVYFYDIYSPNPGWVALETTDQDGIVCALGNGSGVYIATFQQS
jgi:hypothetical protein